MSKATKEAVAAAKAEAKAAKAAEAKAAAKTPSVPKGEGGVDVAAAVRKVMRDGKERTIATIIKMASTETGLSAEQIANAVRAQVRPIWYSFWKRAARGSYTFDAVRFEKDPTRHMPAKAS